MEVKPKSVTEQLSGHLVVDAIAKMNGRISERKIIHKITKAYSQHAIEDVEKLVKDTLKVGVQFWSLTSETVETKHMSKPKDEAKRRRTPKSCISPRFIKRHAPRWFSRHSKSRLRLCPRLNVRRTSCRRPHRPIRHSFTLCT